MSLKSKSVPTTVKKDKSVYKDHDIPEEPGKEEYMDYIDKQEQYHMEYLNQLDQQNIEHYKEQEEMEYLMQQEPVDLPEIHQNETVNHEGPKFIEDNFIFNDRYYLKLQTGPTKYFVLDSRKRMCEIVTIAKEKKEEGRVIEPRKEGRKDLLAHFYISKLIIYPSIPELNSPTMYSFMVNTKDKRFNIGPSILDEIVGELKSQGLFYKRVNATDTVTNAINTLKVNGLHRLDNMPPYPGFFILDGRLVSTNKYHLPTKDQLAEALVLLNDFGEHYGSFNSKLGYICHWILMAPFSYVIKQKGLGIKINNLLLYGTTRTGKSTISKLSGFFWNLDINLQIYSGSIVHSVYQYGVAISRSTYPIIVDEGEILFNNPELASMLKTATHSLKARARYNSYLQRQEEINALSPAIITSNYSKPNDGALGARIDILKYTAQDVRSKEARDSFNQKFKPEKYDGPLKVLRFIGDYVATKVIEDPGILDEDWQEVAYKLFEEMYTYAGVTMPIWIKEPTHPEGVEKSFEDEQNYIISNIKGLIIRKAQTKNYDKNTREYKPVTNKMKAELVVRDSLEPWIYCHDPERGSDAGKKFVWIEKGIENDLKKEKDLNITLDRIAELLFGKIMRKNTGNGQKINVAVFDYDKFLDQF